MCATCGCRKPRDPHLDARHITVTQLYNAALAAGIPPDVVLQNAKIALDADIPYRAFAAELSKPRVVCDIDGTLAERDLPALVAINSKFDTHFRYHDMTERNMDWCPDKKIRKWYEKHKHDPIFLVDLPPYEDAIWALWSLRSGGYNVTIASDREPELLQISKEWLAEQGIQYDDIRIGEGEKERLAETASPDNPMVFFDDNPKRTEDLPRPGVVVYLLDRPWNQDVQTNANVIRVKSWPQLLTHFPAVNQTPVRMNGHSTAAALKYSEDQPRNAQGEFGSGGGKTGGGGKVPAPKAGDHVRIRQWSDGKWRIQHKDANQMVVQQKFPTRTAAIQHAHAQGWTARTGTKVIPPGAAIPAEPPPKAGQMHQVGSAVPSHPQVGPGVNPTPMQIQAAWNEKFPGHTGSFHAFLQSYQTGEKLPGLDHGIKPDSPAGQFFASQGLVYGGGAKPLTGPSISPAVASELMSDKPTGSLTPVVGATVGAGKPGANLVVPNDPLKPAPVQYSPKPAEIKYETQLKFNVTSGAGQRVRMTSSASQAKMTSTAKQAIQAYTGSWYSHINGSLRSGVFSKTDEQRIEHMDTALGQASSTENVIVGRTVDSSVLAKIGQCEVGGKFVDHGYVSTSLYPTGDTGGGKPLTIEVPKGSPGLFLMGTGLTSYGEGEAEFLLPRESRFEVLSKSGNNYRLRYLGTTGAVKASQPDVAGSLSETKIPISGPANNPAYNNPAVKDVQGVIAGAVKVDGPHGSQPGDWYNTKEGLVYTKPMSMERAQNEVATNTAYQILGKAQAGKDVPSTYIAQDKANGQAYVVSQNIAGLKNLSAGQWQTQAAEAAGTQLSGGAARDAQKLWATDALLSNRDALGLAHDNLAVHPSGGTTRIDQGAGMAFRAQGSAKPDWKVGGAWSEPFTMRGVADPKSGVSGNEQAKNVFGRMTNADAAKALGDLRSQVSHDTLQMLRQAWNDQGMPKATIDSNMAVIVDRLNRIPSVQAELMKNPSATAVG